MKTTKSEKVCHNEYRDFNEAHASMGEFLERVYNQKRNDHTPKPGSPSHSFSWVFPAMVKSLIRFLRIRDQRGRRVNGKANCKSALCCWKSEW
jgi:hypothetical protein